MDKVNPLIKAIPEKMANINKLLEKGDKMGMFDSLKLGRQSNALCDNIWKAVDAYKGFQPTDAEAETLLEEMRGITAATEKQLDLLVKMRPVFEKLWIAGLVKNNTKKMDDASIALAKAMIAVAPERMHPESKEMEQKTRVAFEKANAAYGDAKGGEDKQAELDKAEEAA